MAGALMDPSPLDMLRWLQDSWLIALAVGALVLALALHDADTPPR